MNKTTKKRQNHKVVFMAELANTNETRKGDFNSVYDLVTSTHAPEFVKSREEILNHMFLGLNPLGIFRDRTYKISLTVDPPYEPEWMDKIKRYVFAAFHYKEGFDDGGISGSIEQVHKWACQMYGAENIPSCEELLKHFYIDGNGSYTYQHKKDEKCVIKANLHTSNVW